MSSLIVLHQVRVENANAIAGLTYGFPAITHFLGYSHALSRKLQFSHGLTLRGCAVICHHQQVHAYSSGRDYVFSLTRNPLTKEAKTAAFNEEGRMHMTVSLVIECDGTIANGDDGANALEKHLASLCLTQRLAGGTITNIRRVKVINYPETEAATRRLLCRLLPGFALLDRSELLAEHLNRLRQTNPQAEMLDAWLDFSALKIQAIPPQSDTPVESGAPAPWGYVGKPAAGYLVPIVTGYRAISPLYAPGEVDKTRDPHTPFRFVESLYGIGEWRGLHRITDLRQLLWGYHQEGDNYLCRCALPASVDTYLLNDEE
ncbi:MULTISPECIES: type I-F CRISPR-associated protein Csy2 [Yersinia pseudotuberculosis complex]|uniref:CRISPR-associated protein, Csy2 family n=1 Tax=Yersinia wautersii TaxID=1341643 RepID=A0ABP1ZJF9_9GAMM|nr:MULTISPECIES: type I-F CRISPR-associated protein Csy2 [Yersinia pseudotuberculosis complex]CNF83609.1 CRISPR-associated protein%2C Csy2 family [Yersinia pseudotuberculosis]CNL13585.1 CRISPR-associated protein%2C Csy2 family [Yersinia pseudotuberculosis]CRG51398.1 CRISPR-associated protein%2C Csy2 family [Yersinia wautersii]CRY70506.1 CRISPR-associated protein%2C Csy2 family [Yersinia pseudotuberculosis]